MLDARRLTSSLLKVAPEEIVPASQKLLGVFKQIAGEGNFEEILRHLCKVHDHREYSRIRVTGTVRFCQLKGVLKKLEELLESCKDSRQREDVLEGIRAVAAGFLWEILHHQGVRGRALHETKLLDGWYFQQRFVQSLPPEHRSDLLRFLKRLARCRPLTDCFCDVYVSRSFARAKDNQSGTGNVVIVSEGFRGRNYGAKLALCGRLTVPPLSYVDPRGWPPEEFDELRFDGEKVDCPFWEVRAGEVSARLEDH